MTKKILQKADTMKSIVITVRQNFSKGRKFSVVKNVSMRQKIATNVRSQAVNPEQYADQSELYKATYGISNNKDFYKEDDCCVDKVVVEPMSTAEIAKTQTMCNKAIAGERVTQTMGNKAIAGERATETTCNKTIANENIILDGCYNVLENSTMVYELSNEYFVFENGETRIGKQVYSIENAGSSYILRLNTEPQQTVFFSNQDESIVFPDLDKLYDACKEKWFQNSHQEKLTRAANFFKNRGM